MIGVLAIEQTVYLGLFAASCHGFLQAYDVGMGICNVTDGWTLAFLLTVVVIVAHIVGEDFEGIVGRRVKLKSYQSRVGIFFVLI